MEGASRSEYSFLKRDRHSRKEWLPCHKHPQSVLGLLTLILQLATREIAILMPEAASHCAVEDICASADGVLVFTSISAGRGLDIVVCGPSRRSEGGADNARKYPQIMYSNLPASEKKLKIDPKADVTVKIRDRQPYQEVSPSSIWANEMNAQVA